LAGLVVASALVVFGCEDDTTIAPPPPAPQITTNANYSKTYHSQTGQQTGLQDPDVYDLLVTSAGKLWIGNAGGVAIYANLTATTREAAFNQIPPGLTNPKVRRMIEYGGKIYVGTWGGGISVYDVAGDTWSEMRAEDTGLTNDSVSDMYLYGDSLFIATNGGVNIYDLVGDAWASFSEAQGLLDTLVSAVMVVNTPRGEERWYMPRVEYGLQVDELPDHGITLHRPTGVTPVWHFTQVNSGLTSNNITAVFYDAAADVTWIAFSGKGLGVVDIDAATWTYYTTIQGLPSDVVYSITMVNGEMWVATQNGIARRKSSGQWQGYNRSGGLRADRVRRVYSDDPTRLWLAFVENGASRVDPASAE
jgi:ligand-binding sensor domain-containing protein